MRGAREHHVLRAGQVLASVSSILSLIWGLSDSRFRNAEGNLAGSFVVPLAMAAALGVLAVTIPPRWRAFGGWCALALVGQSVVLQLIDAGPLIRYQHYRPLDQLWAPQRIVLLIALGIQCVAVALGIWRRFRSRWAILGQRMGAARMTAAGALLALSSAAVSRNIGDYGAEVLLASVTELVSAANILLAALSFPAQHIGLLRRWIDRTLGTHAADAGRERRLDRVACAAGVWVLTLAATLSWFVYQNHPHIPDEGLYLYQARYFASAQLNVTPPPVPAAFSFYLVPYAADRWYSPFPPGWPAMLAVGVLAGLPWLVNPVLAAGNVLLIFSFVRRLYDQPTARLVVVLLAVSPWYVFMAMNFMSHTFTLTAALLAALALERARRTRHAVWGFASGAAVGVVALTRPLDAVILALLLAVGAMWPKRLAAAPIAASIAGAVLTTAINLPYNRIVTGSAIRSPLETYYEDYFGPTANALGFGAGRGLGWSLDAFPGHSVFEALINASLNTFSVNIELFGWSVGSLSVIILLVVYRRLRGVDHLMALVILSTIAAYSLYWFSGGPDFGARYWYLAIVPLTILTVRGLVWLSRAVDRYLGDAEGVRVFVGVLLLCSIAVIEYFPWRITDKYLHYLRMRPDIRQLAADHHFGRSLVLIRGEWHPDYMSAWAYNPLDPHAAEPIYAWDRDATVRARLLDAYPDRPVWIVDGPTRTDGRFRVVMGPLAPALLRARAADERVAAEEAMTLVRRY